MNKRSLLSFCIVAALAVCCSGCGDPSRAIGESVDIDVIEAEYNNHVYLVFDGHGVVHSPDCKCVTDKQ